MSQHRSLVPILISLLASMPLLLVPAEALAQLTSISYSVRHEVGGQASATTGCLNPGVTPFFDRHTFSDQDGLTGFDSIVPLGRFLDASPAT